MHTALAKQGMGPLFGSVRLQMSVIPQSLAGRTEEGEQHHGKSIEQPKAVASLRRADARPALTHDLLLGG